MAVFIRLFLVILIIYLIIRALVGYGARGGPGSGNIRDSGTKPGKSNGIPPEIGEYVDYEEVDDN
ncbi:MAG: hypothetical protein RBS37_05440 [Bacteroidales bacterium]|jgi:hypothetical protein|nr:hypothetical protein [Bacteroidales bacterium]